MRNLGWALLLCPALAGAFAEYNNEVGHKTAACLRSKIKTSTQNLSFADFKPGQKWHCNEVYYFWNENKELAIFTHDQGAHYGARFKFQVVGTELLETQEHPGTTQMNFYNHASGTGAVTSITYGLPPHIQYNFTMKQGEGVLYFEKVMKTWESASNPMTQYWPAIHQHPMALYGDYPGRPASWEYKALGYGACFLENTQPTSMECF